ncbi:MAG TPA: hypothetical protein VJ801_13280 [Polyangia bacterium]|nr:hypothetical protein [Polyangia bacterium]
MPTCLADSATVGWGGDADGVLARHWGLGACLADDMGLGKTVQARALLLRRALLRPR